MRHLRKRHASGFTLVEIAIVLVVVGLLLGGVLKGQEMMASAKVKALSGEIKAVSGAYYAYQDRFHAVPGDDTLATTHLGATVNGVTVVNATGPANGFIDTGTWVGLLTAAVAGNESALFWNHTRTAGMLSGSGSIGSAVNAVGGSLGINRTSMVTSMTPGSAFVCTGAVDGKLASQLDTSMDDGDPTIGTVQGTEGSAVTTAAAAATSYAPGTSYTVCAGI